MAYKVKREGNQWEEHSSGQETDEVDITQKVLERVKYGGKEQVVLAELATELRVKH